MPKFFPPTRPAAALALMMLFELCLFADFHGRRWQEVIVPLNQPAENEGEGLVIRGNGLGYYAWLRSLLIDHDWDFANEFDDHAGAGDYVPPPTYKTDLGRRANQWSVGPACIWAVYVVPGHFVLKLLGAWSPWATDGYCLPYQLLVGAASLTMSFVGLFVLYRISLLYARPSRAALAAILLTLGSTIIYYDTAEVSMAHGMSATVLAGLVWYWLQSYGSLGWWRWFTVGLLVGAASLMRWQLATFAMLPAGEFLLVSMRARRTGLLTRPSPEATGLLTRPSPEATGRETRLSPEETGRETRPTGGFLHRPFAQRLVGLALAGVGALVAVLPQMIAWRCVYGHWLVEPIQQIAHHWLSPSLWDLLLSQDRSLVYWTPICLLAFLGYFVCRPTARAEATALLLAAFALQVYALASVWGKGEFIQNVGNYAGAFLSRSYGMRHLTEAVVVLAPGLAILLERASKWPFRLVCTLGFLLALWNLLLVYQYSQGLLPEYDGLDPEALLTRTFRFVMAVPLFFLVLIEALGLVCLVLLWGNEEPGVNSDVDKKLDSEPHSPLPGVLKWGVLLLLLTAISAPFLQGPGVGFLYRVYRDSDGADVQYALFVPHQYRKDTAYAVVVYLHGSGPQKWDTTEPPRGPLAKAIRAREDAFDMIAVFPRSPSGFWDPDSHDLGQVLRIVDEVKKSYHVDPDRISLTGVSAGGFAVWNLAARHPDKWAAIAPICGGGNPQDAPKIRHIPCWCFHGEEDKVISVEESRSMIKALRAAGGEPRYDEYPGVGHNCWDKAFRDSDLLDWLRSQRRKEPQ